MSDERERNKNKADEPDFQAHRAKAGEMVEPEPEVGEEDDDFEAHRHNKTGGIVDRTK